MPLDTHCGLIQHTLCLASLIGMHLKSGFDVCLDGRRSFCHLLLLLLLQGLLLLLLSSGVNHSSDGDFRTKVFSVPIKEKCSRYKKLLNKQWQLVQYLTNFINYSRKFSKVSVIIQFWRHFVWRVRQMLELNPILACFEISVQNTDLVCIKWLSLPLPNLHSRKSSTLKLSKLADSGTFF